MSAAPEPTNPSGCPVVETKFFTFAQEGGDPLTLECNGKLSPVTLAYETYGQLNEARDNAILVFHALTGSQHAAGFNPAVEGVDRLWNEECRTGWWDDFIGPNRALDTNLYHVICANYIGGCYGSTGPTSTNPKTGKPYGGDFPIVTLGDVVDSQMRLLDHLGVRTLLAASGGSLGGMMALDLAVRYPERVRCVIPIATGVRASTLQRLHNFEQIYAIEEDPNFNYGHYYDGEPPLMGLVLARMIGHKTFVSLGVLQERAGGQILQGDDDLKGYRLQHAIESYMLNRGRKFVERFDANAYLRIISMWQRFDLTRSSGGYLPRALVPCRDHRFLIFSIDSDVCYYNDEQDELCEGLKRASVNYLHITVHSDKGHDSFLLEPKLFSPHISYVLNETHCEIQ